MMQIIVIVILFIVIIYMIRQNLAISYERRIGRYSIDSMKITELSVLDKLYNKYRNIILFMRCYLLRIKFLVNISKRYEKYLIYGNDGETIDYIASKILIGVLFVLIAIFSHILQGRILGIMGIIVNFMIGYFLYDLYLIYQQKRRTKLIRNELLRAIIIMNNAFKSGKSTIQAVEIASMELPEPISGEFKKIYLDMKYGLSVGTVFERFAKRNNVEEARYLSATLTTLNRTGGNIVKVFNSIEKTLFDKKKLEEELKNLTASSNFVVKVLLFVPFFFVAIIYFMDSTYFDPLFNSGLGYIVLIIMFIMFILYGWFLQKVMKVNV
jgi:tight adherence protein B